ncbi:MAG: hypothetical protein L3J74_08055 [Bacteroidales bacterium]|nr:hypothetical protein [Bacteroidales bacterium]
MMLKIEKILHKNSESIYLQFSDCSVKILHKKDFLKNKPQWQKDIINKKWMNVKIDNVGDLVFDARLDAGADTLKPKCKEPTKNEILEVLAKRTTKRKLIEFISLL